MTGFTLEPSGGVAYGPGCVDQLPELVRAAGQSRAFVVTDPGLRDAGVAGRVQDVLGAAGLEHGGYDEVTANPSTAIVDAGASAVRAFGPTAVVALGGGSSLDAAKAIALLATNPGISAAGELGEARDGLPVIAIPTTAGTGSEANGFGVLEDTGTRRKVYIGHPSVRPRTALLDPELTLGLPPHATAATGLDALVHGVESLASRGANAISAAYASHAITLVGRWLPVAYEDGSDLEARSQLLLGAHLAGRALTISGLGLVHGIGHALTAHAGTPHGVALAAVFEEVMEFSADHAGTAYEQAARALWATPADRGGASAAIEAVQEISAAIGIRKPLRELGVSREMLPSIAAGAAADAVTSNSPRIPTEADVLALVESVF